MNTTGPISTSQHPLLLLVSACFWVMLWLLSWARALIAFTTITAPRIIYFVLTYSLTLTLNFWSFAVLFVLSAIALNYWIRFRYLNDYAQLKEIPLGKPDANELHPDVNTTSAAPNFHHYLDDFLQAVRVFGFLEKPVFHELARHLQTRRLIAGDSMSLDQDKNFYFVVDGMVQVYAQREQCIEGQKVSWDDEDMNGYQLLNEVGSGGTLSSLFTILSLFTEDVKISWQDGGWATTTVERMADSTQTRTQRANSDVSHFELEAARRRTTQLQRRSISSTASTVHLDMPQADACSSDGRSLETIAGSVRSQSVPRKEVAHVPAQIRHGVVARATEDTTLAVIPAEAFSRLTKKFPKATAHIVQVILTRFSRVTFSAAHKYLGLTTEVLRTEKAINEIACHPLPASFYEGGGLQYLRQLFDTTIPRALEHDHDRSTNPSTHSRSPSIIYSQSPLSMPKLPWTIASNRHSANMPASRHQVQAGDLHTSTDHPIDAFRPLSRTFSSLNAPRFVRPGPEPVHSEGFDLRVEVMSCIAKSIGLLQPPLSGSDSHEASPAFPASEASRPTNEPFAPSFGSLSLLDVGDDVSSVTGESSVAKDGGYMSGLDNEVEILFFAEGSTLVRAGEPNTGLFYVIEGFLDILLPIETSDLKPAERKSDLWRHSNKKGSDEEKPKFLFTVKPGGIAGYLASLCSTASYVDIKAKTDTYVGFLPSHALERLLEKRPIVLLTLAKRLISLLSPLVLQIDASLDWMQVDAGQVLWRPGDISDSFYIVINGRLRAINDQNGCVAIVAEYGQGDPVGELDVITSSPRRNTVHAIRDTELIRMPQTLFNAISARNPQTTAQLLRMMASRVRDELDSSANTQSRSAVSELGRSNTNLKTVAVLPVTRSVPVDAFARKLHLALDGIGASTLYLNQASISAHIGRHAFTRMGKLKAASWLADQEQRYRIVLYVADSPVSSAWTQTCIRQADCIMLVGMGGGDSSIGEYERLVLSLKTTARKELILLHPDRSVIPGSTREWLQHRPWVHLHIHVELPGLVLPVSKPAMQSQDPRAMAALKTLKNKFRDEIQKYRGGRVTTQPQRPVHTNDFARLARRICGSSIGLVLGGGGARGISHLGVLRALEEYGIPIDHVGGTSIGAFIGGLYAREGDLISTRGRAKQFSSRMANIWRLLSDVTYPIVAYTTGHELNRAIYKAFYDLHIEDMWLPYFCNTTNLLQSKMEIHETGYAWRFIRASMSLVGLLPPLSDNGNVLVDGGYIDNLPVNAMLSMGASAIFACDVGSIDDNSPRHFGDHISGWWLLLNRWNLFSRARTVPDIAEMQGRLAYVSSVKTLEDAKVASGCLYMAMPVQEYGTLQFGRFDDIAQKGYHAAKAFLEKWSEEGRLPSAFIDDRKNVKGRQKKGHSVRRNSM